MKIFSLKATHEIAERVCRHLDCRLSGLEEKQFSENGEYKHRPLEDVKNEDVFIIHSVHGDEFQTVHDKFCELLFLTATLKADQPRRITVIVPYLCYMRKDRQLESHDPVITQYVARLLESMGADCVVSLDVHNLSAFQNAFRCQTVHLEAAQLFVDYFSKNIKGPITILSPDLGGIKRAEKFRQGLHERLGQDIEMAFMTKERHNSIQAVSHLVGNIRQRTVIIIDDIISSGSTMSYAIDACESGKAAEVHLAVSHGLFTDDAVKNFLQPILKSIVITNTVKPFRVDPQFILEKIVMLDISKLVASRILEFSVNNETISSKDKRSNKDMGFHTSPHH